MINLPDTFSQMLRSIFLLFAITLFSFHTLSAQETDTLRRRDPGGWDFIQVVRNKTVITEGATHAGMREGVWTEYWDSKLPHIVTTYINGQRDGLYMDIRRTGTVELVQYFRKDKLNGPARRYTPNAKIAEESYYSDGVRSGSFTKWYANGNIQEQSNYNNDVRDGKTSYYAENGIKMADYSYDRGKLEGDVTIYGDNGKVTEFGNYTADVQAGTWKEYYASGKLKAEGKYVAGEKDGVWKLYDENGKPLKPVTYKKGKEKK